MRLDHALEHAGHAGGGADAEVDATTNEVLIEESVLGWKEFEMEVVRDKKDNCIIVCSIENFDPMGVHTGDSIVVAPVQTLPDPVHQRLRSAALAIIRALGLERPVVLAEVVLGRQGQAPLGSERGVGQPPVVEAAEPGRKLLHVRGPGDQTAHLLVEPEGLAQPAGDAGTAGTEPQVAAADPARAEAVPQVDPARASRRSCPPYGRVLRGTYAAPLTRRGARCSPGSTWSRASASSGG